MEMSDLPIPAPQTYRTLQVRSVRNGKAVQEQDCVAEEVPIALEFNGISHAVMMATPDDLEDFATGFALSEGIVDSPSQIFDCEISVSPLGYTLAVEIAASCFARLKDMRRNLTGRTGCGLCGTESLSHAVRIPQRVLHRSSFAARDVARAMAAMRAHQLLLSVTGSTHAAAWCTLDGAIALIREDVGRHNALDKLIGAISRTHIASDGGFIAVTSRASYEMVQKAASAGVGALAAVSGVTGLAIEVANQTGLTLLGFARGDDVCVYTHPEQFTWEQQ